MLQPTRPRTWASAVALLLVATTLLLMPLGNDYRAMWWGAFMDFAHVLLFGPLTFLLGKYCWPNRWLSAVILMTCLACSAEIVQPLLGRSASWRDAAYGLIGIGIAYVWLHASWPRAIRIAIVALLAAWPVTRTLPVTLDAIWAWHTFPVLAGSNGFFEKQRWWLQGTTMRLAPSAAQLSFSPSEQGSGAILLPVVRDWTAYETLELTFAFEGEPLLLLISVRDGKRLPPELPRFDLWQRYLPGKHEVRIDLSKLRQGNGFPPIDLEHVQSLHLVAYSQQPRDLVLHQIRLLDPKPDGTE